MASSEYKPLDQEASDDQYEPSASWSKRVSSAWVRKSIFALIILLAITITVNLLLFVQLRETQALLDTQTYGMPQLIGPDYGTSMMAEANC